MGANYSVVFSASNAQGVAIAVGDLVIPSVSDPSSYVVATTAALAGRRPEAVALTPVGSRKGTFQLQQTGTLSAAKSGYTGGESWVRCSAAGRIEACAAGDPLLIGRGEADGRVHLLFALPLFAELPTAVGEGVLVYNGTTGVLTHVPVAGKTQGDVLTLGLGLGISFATPSGGGGSFNPLSITGANVSYDPAAASQSGGLVTVVPDGSGNARNGIITGGQEPTYIAVDAAYNNKPTFSFPGASTKRIGVPDPGVTTGPYTIVIVADSQNANGYICSSPAANDQAQLYAAAAAVRFSSAFLPGINSINTGAIASKNVIIAVGDGASSRLYVNSKTAVTGNAGTHSLAAATRLLGNYANGISGTFAQQGKTAYYGEWGRALTNAECGTMLDGLGLNFGVIITP